MGQRIEAKNYDARLESAIIGAILATPQDAKAIITVMVSEWFYFEKNRVIYDLLKKKILNGEAPDLTLAASWLTEMGVLGEIGGMKYLADCLEAISTQAHTAGYIQQVRRFYYDRQIYVAALRVAEEPSYANNDQLRQLCMDRDTVKSSNTLDMRDAVDHLHGLVEKQNNLYDFFDGFPKLNKFHNGASPGDVLTIGARPGAGKTILATKLTYDFAKKYNEPVLLFTTEMTREEAMTRMVSPVAGVPGWKFRKRVFHLEMDIPNINGAIEKMLKLPIYIMDKPSPTLGDIQAAILATKCKLCIVDYLQRLNLEIGQRDSRPEALGRVMSGLKNTSRDLGIMTVVMSQLDRETDKLKKSQSPQMADLKGSGDIEAESNCIMLLWKHNKRDKSKKKEIVPTDIPFVRPVEIIVAKNRSGPSDVSVQMIFDEKFIRFHEWNEDEEKRRNAAMAQQAGGAYEPGDNADDDDDAGDPGVD